MFVLVSMIILGVNKWSLMNYKLCELYNKYTILSKYEQNNISFK